MSTTTSSLAEARAIYETLQRIETKLEGIERKARNEVRVSLTEVFGLLTDIRVLLRQLNLPDDLEAAIGVIYATTSAIRGLHAAIVALQVASGPVGWMLAGVGVLAMGVSAVVAINSASDRRVRR
jgi:hypothetical protein